MPSKATETPECPLYFPSHTYCYPASKEKKLHELRFQLLFVGNQLKTTGFTTVVGLFLPQPGGQENSCYITLFPKNTTNFFASFSCSSDSTPTLSDKKRDAYRWLYFFCGLFIPLLGYYILVWNAFSLCGIKAAFMFE